jgi:hypothetical protein
MVGYDANGFKSGRIFANFPDSEHSSLSEICKDFSKDQRQSWLEYRNGFDAMEHALHRTVQCSGFSVIIQHNPARAVSTNACVGEKEVAQRPCFLCSHRLPHNQKAIVYRDDYLILCNPMPIFPLHLTIAHIVHQPQGLLAHISAYFQLIEDFGSEWVILYNGPKCGASAPDHLHFQAAKAGYMPIERELDESGRLVLIAQNPKTSIYQARNMGRTVIVLEGNDVSYMVSLLSSFLQSLKTLSGQTDEDEESMINLIGTAHTGKIRLIVFPRLTHRPRAFFYSGEEKILVSPAVAEMGGIIVTPVLYDYERLTEDNIEEIYQEVSLPRHRIEGALEHITALT